MTGPEAVIQRTAWISLADLLEHDPITFYELVMACRDRSHVLFGNTGTKLVDRALVQQVNADGTALVHDSVREVVLASVQGEGFDMTLGELA